MEFSDLFDDKFKKKISKRFDKLVDQEVKLALEDAMVSLNHWDGLKVQIDFSDSYGEVILRFSFSDIFDDAGDLFEDCLDYMRREEAESTLLILKTAVSQLEKGLSKAVVDVMEKAEEAIL